MKGCLRLSSLPSRPHLGCDKRKCVAFCPEGSEEVHLADEWDRTPAAAQKLSYEDLLELKEIQNSLPFAPQTPDPLCPHRYTEYLTKVPLGLVPLVPETYKCSSGNSSSNQSSSTASLTSPPSTPSTFPPFPWQSVQPTRPPNQRPMPQFSFLPLLETPPPPIYRSPSPSPPSSPRTFAEFEASLENGYDNVLHHATPQPTVTSAPLDSPSPPEPDSLFRLPPRVISPSTEHSPDNQDKSYFPPFPRSPDPNSGPKDPLVVQAPPSPVLVAPPPLSLIQPAPLSPPAVGGSASEPQTRTQANSLTQGQAAPASSLTDTVSAKEAGVGAEKEKVGSSSANGAPPTPVSLRVSNSSLPSGASTRPPPQVGSKDNTTYLFERKRTLSPPPSTRLTQTKPSNTGRSRELQSSNPMLVPYCMSMARRSSPCSSPVIVPLGG